MKQALALSAFFLAAACFGQIPDHVPSDGLVAWWSFNGTTDEEFGLTSESQVAYGEDRFGEGERALDMLNSTSMFVDYGSAVMELGQLQSITISLWSKLDDASAYNHFIQHRTYEDVNYNFVLSNNNQGLYAYHGTSNDSLLQTSVVPPTDEWFMLTWTLACDTDSVRSSMFLNGTLIGQESFGSGCLSSFPSDVLYVGGGPPGSIRVKGSIDDLGLWDRPLTGSEVFSFYDDSVPLEGCTDASACNFNSEASVDNGTCHFNCLFCNDGTVWNEVTQGCDVANPSDTDFDGCVGMIDLLNLLSVFGTCVEEDSQVAEWSCGDPLDYQGYDYETVLIGDQCWFAENLRATHYQNGDELGSSLEGDSWGETEFGAYSIYGEGNGSCGSANPEFDACDANASQEVYGLLYNGHAAMDERNLCPNHWHVGSDVDWLALKEQLSEEGFSGQEGAALKTSNGWKNDGGGTDVFGFHAVSGGSRNFAAGSFNYAGEFGRYWTSTMSDDGNGWRRSFAYNNSLLERYDGSLNTGSAVRCIKNAE